MRFLPTTHHRWRGHLSFLRANSENSRGTKQIPVGKVVGRHPVRCCSHRLARLQALTRFRHRCEVLLSGGSRRAPERVGDAHLADQPANFQRHSWSAAAVSRLPAPIRSETGTAPTDDGIRLHNRLRLDGIWHRTIQPNKDQATHGTEGHSLRHMPAVDVKLMIDRFCFCGVTVRRRFTALQT
jgi:hypothetical protein